MRKVQRLTLVPLKDLNKAHMEWHMNVQYVVASTKNMVSPLVGTELTQDQVQEWIETKYVDVVINRRKD